MRKKMGTTITVSDGEHTLYIAGRRGTTYTLTPQLKHAEVFCATTKVLNTIRGQVVTQFPGTFTNTMERWAEQ